MRRLLLALALCLLPLAASAQCAGENLLQTMAPGDRARIDALAEAQPFPRGNFWRASRDGQNVTILGTYHFDDPRHAPALSLGEAALDGAATLLVEAGPDEEAQLLDHMARDPSVMMITSGPTLLEQLPRQTWERLSAALADRGIPGFMAAKMQPWYATLMLGIPPCALAEMVDPKGLDGLMIDAALARDIPVRALEPYDTVFTLFTGMSREELTAMIDSTLAMEPQAEDFAVTLADTYFAGDSRAMWEMMRVLSYAQPGATPAKVDAELAVMEEALMAARNRAWIPVIEAAAKDGPLVVAFGALHLSGQEGVLNLMARNGWVLEPVALP